MTVRMTSRNVIVAAEHWCAPTSAPRPGLLERAVRWADNHPGAVVVGCVALLAVVALAAWAGRVS